MIAIIDYKMGNLRSVQKAFEFVGYDAIITDDRKKIEDASHIVLPGVGAAGDALHQLRETGLFDVILKETAKGKPFLGICLGMQLMFEQSMEKGQHECLGLIPGEVVLFHKEGLKIPHIGFNNLESIKVNELFCKEEQEQYVYFVHSFHASGVPEEYVIARANYGYPFVCAVNRDQMYGLQFHPEKSGKTGLAMLYKFGGIKS